MLVDCLDEARPLRLGNWRLLATARGRHVLDNGEALAPVAVVNKVGTVIVRRGPESGHGGHQEEGGQVELHG